MYTSLSVTSKEILIRKLETILTVAELCKERQWLTSRIGLLVGAVKEKGTGNLRLPISFPLLRRIESKNISEVKSLICSKRGSHS